MAEMSAAFVASDLGANHAEAVIGMFVDQLLVVRRVKAWPATT